MLEQRLVEYVGDLFREIFRRCPALESVDWEQDHINGAPRHLRDVQTRLFINDHLFYSLKDYISTEKANLEQECRRQPLFAPTLAARQGEYDQLLSIAEQVSRIIFETFTEDVLDFMGNIVRIQATPHGVALRPVSAREVL